MGVLVTRLTGSLVFAVWVLAVVEDVVQVRCVLIIFAGMFMENCHLIQPVLGHLQPPCGLQEEFESTDVGFGFDKV